MSAEEPGTADAAALPEEPGASGYELFIGVLSVLSIVNLVLVYVVDDPNLDDVVLIMTALLSALFFGDFVYRLITAEDRQHYVVRQWGWADLLSSVPVPQVKILRIFRLVAVSRQLRTSGTKGMGRSLLRDRAESALLTLLLLGILVLEFGSLQMLHIEQYADGANITTASDALWYVIVTISTVGYGDRYPVTGGGRLLGSFVIVVGVGIFGTFTGYLANVFLSPKKTPPPREAAAAPDTARPSEERIRELMAQQHAAMDELERLLRVDPR